MRARAITIVLSMTLGMLAGCNAVFGLDPPVDRDAARDDGPPGDGDGGPDARPDAPACTIGNITIAAEADMVIVNNGTSINYGTGPVLNVGMAIGSNGLWRFDLTGVPTTLILASAQLRLPFIATSNACAATCGSCATIDMPGTVKLAFARSDWNEAAATWHLRDVAVGWAADGASGPGDRSAVIGSALHADDQQTAIDFDPADIAVWRTIGSNGNKLSFLAEPSDGAVLIIAARENGTAETCPPIEAPANLSINYCSSIP